MKAKYTLTTEAIDDEGRTVVRCTSAVTVIVPVTDPGPDPDLASATAAATATAVDLISMIAQMAGGRSPVVEGPTLTCLAAPPN